MNLGGTDQVANGRVDGTGQDCVDQGRRIMRHGENVFDELNADGILMGKE
jgi:hypothetical protein